MFGAVTFSLQNGAFLSLTFSPAGLVEGDSVCIERDASQNVARICFSGFKLFNSAMYNVTIFSISSSAS